MSFNASLYAFLTAQGALTDLISDRVYPAGAVPQTVAWPYVTYQRISNVHERHQGGTSHLAHPRYQIDVWAKTELEVDGICETIKDVLEGYRGTIGSVNVRGAFLESDEMSYEGPVDASEKPVYRVSMDFLIWHTE